MDKLIVLRKDEADRVTRLLLTVLAESGSHLTPSLHGQVAREVKFLNDKIEGVTDEKK